MLMTNSAHAFSHSLIHSLTHDSYFLESCKRIWEKVAGPYSKQQLWIMPVTYRFKQSIFHWLWNNVLSLDLLKYGPWMYQYTTFKYCFGFILVLPSQDQFQKLYLKRTMEDLQQRGSHMKEDRTLEKQSAEVSTDQENYLASQGAIAEKPLKKKEVINKVWQYLIHHRKNPVWVFCRPNLQCHQWYYHFTPPES